MERAILRNELSDADLKALAKKDRSHYAFGARPKCGRRTAVQSFHAKTLKNLLDKGVNVLMGSDDVLRTTRGELNYWYTLGYVEYPKVLKILCENTPRAIFPNRKIGKIADGYEASFLVLGDNPVNNILKIRVASFKMKTAGL